jgi:PAS domain S-box-containing protein
LQVVALQALFDLSDDAIAIVKGDQSIFDINPAFCRVFGYSREHLIDRRISDLFAHDSDWQRLSVKRDVGFAETPWLSVPVVHQCGHTFPVAVRLIHISAEEREHGFVILLIREVFLSKKAPGEHAYYQDRLLRLTAGLAHDFNNVLAVISGNVQLAHMKSDRCSAEPFLRQAELGCAMAARMIDQLFMICQTRRLDLDVISIPDFLQNRLTLFQGAVGSGVRIRLEFLHQVEAIRADLVGLEQALLNLILNANEAMPDGGTIDIIVSQIICEVVKELVGGHIPAGTYYQIAVKDNGMGMPQHIRRRAFEPYITTKVPREAGDLGSTVGLRTGCGLGLAQVHGYVTQSGGGVDLDSAIGHGTTVSLFLPLI